MAAVLLGIVVLVFGLWALHRFSRANPRNVAGGVKLAGGVGALAGAALLTARGQIGLALPLGMAGLALLGWLPGMPAGLGQRWNKSPGQVSRVRTAFIEMELAHDTGAMQGKILAGPYEGTTLDALNIPTLTRLLGDIDEESRALLAAYLDRRDARWRANDPGGGLPGPWPAAGGERGRDHARPPDAHEETASRPGGFDVPCGSGQPGQGRTASPTSLTQTPTQL
jgi:hypothetical protein